MKNKLSSIETNLLLIQNSWATISNEISKHISQLIESTLSDIDSKVLGLTNSLKESLLEKINSLEINGEIDLSGINEFKDEISNLINNVNQNIAELKNIYQSIPSPETTAQTINFDQVLGEINIKLDEIKFAQAQREFVVPEFPDAEYLKNFSEEMRAGLETLKKISEEISLSTSSLTFNPSVKFDESLQAIDTQIREIKTFFDEMATSQFEIQNNIGNLAEKVTVVVTEVPKISGTLKKDISEEFKVLKSELLSELKKQGQSLTLSINSINESVQSLKGYPAIIIFATLIIIGAMILLKFVF
jgi:prefoldin subunit 5